MGDSQKVRLRLRLDSWMFVCGFTDVGYSNACVRTGWVGVWVRTHCLTVCALFSNYLCWLFACGGGCVCLACAGPQKNNACECRNKVVMGHLLVRVCCLMK